MKTFIIRERRHLDALLAFIAGNWEAMSQTKHPMQVDIKPESAKRSTQANRYYWQILHQIEEQGWVEGRQYSADLWHEYAKRRFLGLVDLPGGASIGISTTDLSTKEFQDYVQKVEAWAAQELGITFVEVS